MAGGSLDWMTLINHQSALLTETKNLVGETRKIVEESQVQTQKMKAMLKEAKAQNQQSRWVLFIAVLTLLASVILPFIIKGSSN